MFNLGFGEILLICAVLIIVVGPERLPSLMKNVGKTLRTVRQASRELQQTVGLDELLRDDITHPLPPPAPRIPPMATIAHEPSPSPPQPQPVPQPAGPEEAGAFLASGDAAAPAGAVGAVGVPSAPPVASEEPIAPITGGLAPEGIAPIAPPAVPIAATAAPAVASGHDHAPAADSPGAAPPAPAPIPAMTMDADAASISERMLALHTLPATNVQKAPDPPSATADAAADHSSKGSGQGDAG